MKVTGVALLLGLCCYALHVLARSLLPGSGAVFWAWIAATTAASYWLGYWFPRCPIRCALLVAALQIAGLWGHAWSDGVFDEGASSTGVVPWAIDSVLWCAWGVPLAVGASLLAARRQ